MIDADCVCAQLEPSLRYPHEEAFDHLRIRPVLDFFNNRVVMCICNLFWFRFAPAHIILLPSCEEVFDL